MMGLGQVGWWDRVVKVGMRGCNEYWFITPVYINKY